MGQRYHDAAFVGIVHLKIPRQAAALNRRSTQRELDTLIPGRSAVQVEQDEAGAVAASDVVHDLVEGLLAVHRRIEAKPIVQEAQLRSELARSGELRLEVEVRTPEVVPVPAVRSRLVLERGTVSVWSRILAHRGHCRS